MTIYTTRQLRELGTTKTRQNKAVADGRLIKLKAGIYSTTGSLADIASLYPEGAVTGLNALALHDLTEESRPVLLRVPHIRTPLANSHIRLIRSEAPSRSINGIRTVNVAQALSDALAHEKLENPGNLLLNHYTGVRGGERLEADLAQLKRPSAIRELAFKAGVGTASKWERTMLFHLRKAGLEPVPNFKLEAYYWDLAFPAARVVIDWDSLHYHLPHNNNDTFYIGLWKSIQAVQLGWAPLKFTDTCTNYHLELVRDVIKETVAHRTTLRPHSPVPGTLKSPAWQFHEGISFGTSF